ncbi:hypothetical protein J2X31_001453 [Flavobacterium arsenatis]|uniref:Tetratricopeptide repeat protein n=1 Tax=Flavobacterium arsenatis TaxID=1484332 RepID=A0ABU1TNA0_9FLAO|nr:hypothetical protein [Flavobacterium arsenatis]MDR6967442.1 hypothetical protein [Flavobacterium arsenatis]
MIKYKFLLVLLIGISGFSQTKVIYNKSVEAYQNKDYALFLKLTQQLDSIRPAHPTFTYNLASAFALNGKSTEAFSVLKQMILANNTVAFEEEPDFEALRNSEGFQFIKELKASQNKTIAQSKFKVSLSEKDLHPESVFYVSNKKLWLASSIRNKKIVSFDVASGKCIDWFVDVKYSVFAMKADAKEEFLWVATSAIPEMNGFSKEMEGKNEILKIEIATKKIVQRFSVEGNHVFGDLIVGKNNEVYVSDSAEPLVYKISNDKISVWKDFRNEAFNLQGITFDENQTKLFIADYLKGIVMIDLKSKSHSWLKFPENATKKGIDGLVFYKNSLIAIHNGVTPIRIVHYKLNKENDKILDFVVLDHNRNEFNEPALASVLENKVYFFANSPWKLYDKNFVLDTPKLEAPKLFELSLE